MMVTRRERDLTARGELRRAVGVARPAFEQYGAEDRALHGAAHFVPSDRRSGVQDHASVHAGDRVACHRNSFDHRRAGEIGIERLPVGGLDARMIDQPRQRPTGLAITARRRHPLDLQNFAARVRNRVGERGQADVEHLQVLSKQIHRHFAFAETAAVSGAAIRAASRTA